MQGDSPSGGPSEIGFGFGSVGGQFAQTVPPELGRVQATLDALNQAALNLTQKINTAMMGDIAEAAVTTDLLSGKVLHDVNVQMEPPQAVLAGLQTRVQNQIVSDMGTALELGSGLGVIPPLPNEPCPVPTCVQIVQEAEKFIYTTALQYYRCAGYPNRISSPTERLKVLDFLYNCLPNDQEYIAQLTLGVESIDNSPNPDVVINEGTPPGAVPGVVLPGIGGAPGQLNPDRGQIVSAGASGAPIASIPIATPPTGAIHPGLIAQAAAQPFINVMSSPRPPTVASPATPQQLAQAIGTCTPQWNFDANGYFTGGTFCPPITGCNPWPATPDPGPDCEVDAYPPESPGGCYEYVVTCTTVPQSPPGTPPPPRIPEGPTPPPPYPPPPKPPCPPQQPTCGPTNVYVQCPTPEKKPPPEKKCPPEKHPQVCVYKNPESGICYVSYTDDETTPPPSSPDDIRIFCGPPDSMDIADIARQCCASGGNQPPPPDVGPPQVVPATGPQCDEFGPTTGLQVNDPSLGLSIVLGLRDANGDLRQPYPNAGVTDIAERAANSGVATLALITDQISEVFSSIVTGSGCFGGPAGLMLLERAALGFLRIFTGGALNNIETPLKYKQNFACPVEIPDIQGIITSWLGNEISDDQAVCWAKAQGMRPDAFKLFADANRSKFSALQWGTLYMRDKIGKDEFAQHIRELGFTRDYDPQATVDLLQQIPPTSDIIRMMVRDAADNVNIDWTKEDAEFPNKYQGQLKTWGEQQGIPVEYMEMLWRAHYSIPSPGQLYNMLHRLSTLPAGDANFVSRDDIRNALQQQDISPKWVDRLMAISFNLLGRRDIQRAAGTNSISNDQTRDAYTKLGFESDDIDILVDSQNKLLNQAFIRRGEVKAYAAGLMTFSEFDNSMRFAGADDNIMAAAKTQATNLRNAAMRKRCEAAYRRRFLTGDIDATQVQSMLSGLGLDDQTVQALSAGWQCEADARGREITAGAVNSLYAQGLIDEGQYIARLRRLNFDSDDAVLLLRYQQRLMNIKATKAQLAAQKAAQAEANRLQRQLQTAANRAARAEAAAARAAAKARSVKQLREKRLIEAGEKWSEHGGDSLPDAIMYIKALFNQTVSSGAYTADEIIAALLLVAGDKGIADRSSFEAALATALTVQVPAELV